MIPLHGWTPWWVALVLAAACSDPGPANPSVVTADAGDAVDEVFAPDFTTLDLTGPDAPEPLDQVGTDADGEVDADAAADADGDTSADIADVPDAVDAVEVADTPDATDAPDVPDVMDTADVPEVNDVPDVTDTPDTPDVPDVPDIPDVPDVPDVTDTPDVPPLTCPPGASPWGSVCRIDCQVLVVGEGTGGTAAALASADRGVDTCLVSFFPWLGGQSTTQGVSALDESVPANSYAHWSKDYRAFRSGVRQHYLSTYSVTQPQNDSDGADGPAFDPGSCWVSRLCYEPQVGAAWLQQRAQALVSTGKLRILQDYRLASALTSGNFVQGVVLEKTTSAYLPVEVRGTVTLDATELGDLLALAGVPFRSGAESKADTGETHARNVAAPECVQPFTYTFMLEKRPAGENHLIPKPNGYAAARYSLFCGRNYKVFNDPTGQAVFWTYRRLLAAGNFSEPITIPFDVAMINWGPDGNDFDTYCLGDTPSGCDVIGKSPADAAAVLARARDYTLGFVYWLQHDAPRDDGSGYGYPNLKLRKDFFPTGDGLSPYPYIRESRRLRAVTTVREQDLAVDGVNPRATLFPDSVGTAWYPMDLHSCPAGETTASDPSWKGATRPTQVPLGALVPQQHEGLLAAAKNIGTTHLSNGSYRLHPVEWHIGEAAGTAAAMAVQQQVTPRTLLTDTARLRKLQHVLANERRMPLYWWSDVAPDDQPLWTAAQMLGVTGVIVGYPGDLALHPTDTLKRGYAAVAIARLFGLQPVVQCKPSFSDVPCDHAVYGYVQALADNGVTSGCGDGKFCVDDLTTRAQFATFLVRAAKWGVVKPNVASFSDVPASDALYGYVETAKAHGVFAGETDGKWFGPTEAIQRRAVVIFGYNYLRVSGGW